MRPTLLVSAENGILSAGGNVPDQTTTTSGYELLEGRGGETETEAEKERGKRERLDQGEGRGRGGSVWRRGNTCRLSTSVLGKARRDVGDEEWARVRILCVGVSLLTVSRDP